MDAFYLILLDLWYYTVCLLGHLNALNNVIYYTCAFPVLNLYLQWKSSVKWDCWFVGIGQDLCLANCLKWNFLFKRRQKLRFFIPTHIFQNKSYHISYNLKILKLRVLWMFLKLIKSRDDCSTETEVPTFWDALKILLVKMNNTLRPINKIQNRVVLANYLHLIWTFDRLLIIFLHCMYQRRK